jgi:hypothetical protein
MFGPSRSYDYYSVGGASCANGFDLEFSTVLGHHKTFSFRVPGSTEEASRSFDWFTAIVFGTLFVFAMQSYLYWPKVFVIYLLYRSVDALLERSYKSWHWVEHQAALWLEGELESKRLEDIYPISTRCGASGVLAQTLLLSSIVMVAVDHGVWALPVFVSALASWTAFRRRRHLPLMKPWMRNMWVACAWPATLLCLTGQRILFMRTPNRWQTAWAKHWAKEVAPQIADSLVTDGPPRIVKVVSPRTS